MPTCSGQGKKHKCQKKVSNQGDYCNIHQDQDPNKAYASQVPRSPKVESLHEKIIKDYMAYLKIFLDNDMALATTSMAFNMDAWCPEIIDVRMTSNYVRIIIEEYDEYHPSIILTLALPPLKDIPIKDLLEFYMRDIPFTIQSLSVRAGIAEDSLVKKWNRIYENIIGYKTEKGLSDEVFYTRLHEFIHSYDNGMNNVETLKIYRSEFINRLARIIFNRRDESPRQQRRAESPPRYQRFEESRYEQQVPLEDPECEDARRVLKMYNIKTDSDWRKWSRANHPDKFPIDQRENVTDIFKKVSDAVDVILKEYKNCNK